MSADTQKATVAVDVGGTFTDLLLVTADGHQTVRKVPTVTADPAEGIIAALKSALEDRKLPPSAVKRFLHGTTIATNAVLERKGARVGLLTTRGFSDVLEIGRQMRSNTYALEPGPETPAFLCPGRYRLEIDERTGADGKVITPLDEAGVITAVEKLVADGVTSIAIVYLFSFANPKHEERTAEIIRKQFPQVSLALSSSVDPAFREYERTVVTVFDAYVKPVVNGYLARLSAGLADVGVTAPLQVMQSRGGLMGAAVASERPVNLFLSGPAAGVVGACACAEEEGLGELITIDIGGTSADIALVEGLRPALSDIARIDGYPVRVSMIDVNAVAAGGGSIAWVTNNGGLRVGPHSAGSNPGPACYGRGGTEPTITDASLVLGYMEPGAFAGGQLNLSHDKAMSAMSEKVASAVGLTPTEASRGVHAVINAKMAEAIRLVSLKRGHDPRNFTLVSLGGAGGLHATALAEDLEINQVLVPRHPGVTAALGLLSAPVEHEASRSFAQRTDTGDTAGIEAVFDQLEAELTQRMEREGIAPDQVERRYVADVCYVGQSHYLKIPYSRGDVVALGSLHTDFLAEHARVFGHAREAPTRIVTLRLVHTGPQQQRISAPLSAKTVPSVQKFRNVTFPSGHVMKECPIIDRDTLSPGSTLAGGAIIEQADTTTLLPPGWAATILKSGNILLTRTNNGGRDV
ncbi:hydantoinase/oxoprolinase family protein [Leptospira interrogans]